MVGSERIPGKAVIAFEAGSDAAGTSSQMYGLLHINVTECREQLD